MIGVFDSGYGGLTVLKSFLSKLPEYDYLYLGDNARAPYGSRSPETIYNYTREGVDYLFNKGCKLIILACNTASAEALRRLQQEYLIERGDPELRILGVVKPLVEEATKVTNKHVGILATKGTVISDVYKIELEHLNSELRITQQVAPLLVPMIEEGITDGTLLRMALRRYLKPLKDAQVDTLILACTHYPLIQDVIKEKIGRRINVLDSGLIVANSLVSYLERHPELNNSLGKNKKLQLLTTDTTKNFSQFGEKIIGREIKVESISL